MADPDLVRLARIGAVLPLRETFTLAKSGAVALCTRDFARFSRFADEIAILGAGECDYSDVDYRRIEGWRRWWKRDRHAYAEAVARDTRGFAMLEAQNRPAMIARLRRPGLKLALHLHNDPQSMDGSRSVTERAALLEACERVYCVSDFIRRRFLDGLEDVSGRAIVIPNGVPLGGASLAKERIVVFTGRVIAIKGVAELVRAFALAAPDMPGWRLVVAGHDPDGLFSSPRSAVARERAALGERLELRGQVAHSEALALLARAEIAAVPSLWEEPCGRAAIEALAAGCALIATRRGGLGEVAEGAGLMVEPADTAGFAAALRRLGGDADLRRQLQTSGLRRARENYDIERATQKLDEARSRLLGPT